MGGRDVVKVDVRVIAASNRDLQSLIVLGQFREDLFYRLNVIPIEVPPLRVRKDDIPLLVDHFITVFCAENGKRAKTLDGEALAYFLAYDWPGNVRELRNMVERLVIMTAGNVITPEDLPAPLRRKESGPLGGEVRERSLKEARDGFERAYILAELRAHQWNMNSYRGASRIERSHRTARSRRTASRRPSRLAGASRLSVFPSCSIRPCLPGISCGVGRITIPSPLCGSPRRWRRWRCREGGGHDGDAAESGVDATGGVARAGRRVGGASGSRHCGRRDAGAGGGCRARRGGGGRGDTARGERGGRRCATPADACVSADDAAGANLALISVPGMYAGAEALKALRAGLHVMLFSDNVDVAAEVELKRYAAERSLLMMGPDCGTAIIDGIPLGFANAVPRGRIGLAAASGAGLQEVISLVAAEGEGVSQAIGLGGRDLSDAVGGLMLTQALSALARDRATEVICVIGKPPGATVAQRLAREAGRLGKPCVSISGRPRHSIPWHSAATLEDAARAAVALARGTRPAAVEFTLPAADIEAMVETGVRGLRPRSATCAACTRAALSPTRGGPARGALPEGRRA